MIENIINKWKWNPVTWLHTKHLIRHYTILCNSILWDDLLCMTLLESFYWFSISFDQGLSGPLQNFDLLFLKPFLHSFVNLDLGLLSCLKEPSPPPSFWAFVSLGRDLQLHCFLLFHFSVMERCPDCGKVTGMLQFFHLFLMTFMMFLSIFWICFVPFY